MIEMDENNCPDCGGELRFYDNVRRIVRTKGGKVNWITLRRMKCNNCRHIHRELPKFIFPYKQYESEVIIGVLEGFITADTLGFEDFPCEMTMFRWRSQNLHSL